MLKKLLVAGVMMTLVLTVFAGVAVQSAGAQSMSLCQTVDALVLAGVIAPDKVAAAKAAAGCTTTAVASFTRSLTLGSTGADVTTLQSWLISQGYQIPAGATGYFGAQTQAAVKAYQINKSITPAVGYFGPLTMAAVNAQNVVAPVIVTPTPVTPAASSALEGTDGSISDVNLLSTYSNEEVGDGQSNVKVAGFEVEASNDGDIQLKSIKLNFDPTGNTGSDHMDDYIDGVSVYVGSTKVGSADVSDFTEGSTGIFTKTITLDNAIVLADKTVKVYVAIDSVNNLDTGDIGGDSWTVDVDNIRFIDGSGVTTTDDSTGDINAMNVGINFVSFSTAADTNLKVTLDSSSPDAGIVMVDDNSGTDGVVLLKGKITVEGDSDVVVDQLPITLTVTGATQIDYITDTVTLTIDGNDYSETVASTSLATATSTFDNLDLTLSAGDTYAFTISIDVLELSGNDFNEGDTILASLTSTNRGNIDAENEEGDNLTAGERSGTAIGEAQELRTQGVSVSLVSDSATKSAVDANDGDSATFTLKFKVTAVGADAYVGTTAASGVNYVVDYSGTATTTDISAVLVNDTDTDITAGGLWLIDEGTSETITLTVVRNASSQDGLYRLSLSGVNWTDVDTSTNPLPNTYTSNLDSYVTDYVALD